MSQVHIEVNLLGRRFAVGCPKEEQASLVESVALLEQRMAEVRDVGRVVEVDKIAIIAALNLANDLLKLQKNPPPSASDLDIEEIQRKIDAMNDTIDQAMLEQNRMF